MIFYTADLHFGHENVIKYCNRPFPNIEEMNETLIKNWNSVVTTDDTVYVVGDFCYRSAFSMKPVLLRLKGTKHLIMGNHDHVWIKNIKPEDFFASVSPLTEIVDDGTTVVLCHYPMLSWNRAQHGSIHVHGHIHNSTYRDENGNCFSILQDMYAYNAGVDVNGFLPVTLAQLKENKEKFYKEHGKSIKRRGGI
ncbi:MAG: metallophosphoesterase [Clostridiaceae bacterium]|jgi:calcineurin-like phosphoesterase family protein|nr:metallophosphoesterase [Clostridiaceae bacterium]